MTFLPLLSSDPKAGVLSKPKLIEFGSGKSVGFWKDSVVTATQTAPCRNPLWQEALLSRNLAQVIKNMAATLRSGKLKFLPTSQSVGYRISLWVSGNLYFVLAYGLRQVLDHTLWLWIPHTAKFGVRIKWSESRKVANTLINICSTSSLTSETSIFWQVCILWFGIIGVLFSSCLYTHFCSLCDYFHNFKKITFSSQVFYKHHVTKS